MKRIYLPLFNLLAAALVITGCGKNSNTVTPVPDNTTIQGTWALTNISGEIDSTNTINGATSTSTLTTKFDSVKSQITQSANGASSTYPYKQTIQFNGDGTDIITEAISQVNEANVLTNYAFTYNTYWSLASNLQTFHGLNILGFEKVHVFGNRASIPAKNANPGTIQYLLANPMFGSYDLSKTTLVLYLHLEYSGNPDVITNGVVTNPTVKLVADYTINYKKSS
jgi:hypothetical protein